MCTRQSRKVIWDMHNTLFLTLYLSKLLLLLSFRTRKYVHGLSCHSLKFLWKPVNSKPPTIPSGVVAYTLSDNLSRNSCIWTKCKSWKSWLSWTICAIFSSLQAKMKEISAIKNCKIAVAKKLMSHTFSVKFRVFRREFLRNHSVYWAQIFKDNWNCYALLIFRVFIFF